MIGAPPGEPALITTRPSRRSNTSVGLMLERGRLPGCTRLAIGRPCVSAGASIDNFHRASGSIRLRYFGPRALTQDNSVQSHPTTLVNLDGEIIGINTAIYTQSYGYQGVGFALPSNTIAQVYNQLIGPEHRVARGSIGVEFNAQPNPSVLRVYGIKNGVIISNVIANGPAQKAGLKTGDAIISVDGKEVKTGDELVGEISQRKPGSNIKLGYIREGKHGDANVVVEDRMKLFGSRLGLADEEPEEDAAPKQTRLGITVRDISPEVATRLGIAAGKGVQVTDVKPDSFGDSIQIGRGDVILEINKQPVTDSAAFEKLQAQLKSGQDVVLLVRPRGSTKDQGPVFLAGVLP